MNPNTPFLNSLEKFPDESPPEHYNEFHQISNEERNIDPNKIINLKVNIDNPSSEIVKEQTYEDLYVIIEKLASKRRTGSDNLISRTNMKLSNQNKLSKIPTNLYSPQNQFFTPDKPHPGFQFQPYFPSQNKIQSMNFANNWNNADQRHNTQQMNMKNSKPKGLKTIDNPEILGFHKLNLSKVSNSEVSHKKIIFTEPNMETHEEPNFLRKKHSKFSGNQNVYPMKINNKINADNTQQYEKNKSVTNFLKPNYSTGFTSNSRPTKPTEEDFDSEEISEGKNCETNSQDVKNIKENYLLEGGYDYEIIEKMNELSDGVKYTFGGVGISQENEQNCEGEEEEIKKDDEILINKPNIPSLKELKKVLDDIEKRKFRYEEIDHFLSFIKKTHEKSRSEHMFTESVIGKQQEFPHKNEITSPFTPKFHPKKLETIDEYTKLIFKKHLDNLKNKKRDIKSDDLNVRDKNCKVF